MIPRIPLRQLQASAKPRAACGRHFQCLYRPSTNLSPLKFLATQSYSTAPPTPPSTTQPPPPSDLRSQFTDYTPPPPKPKRSLRRYIYAVAFLGLGLTAGQYMRLVIAPPPLPAPGTREDTLMVEYLHSTAEKLPLVKSLSEDPEWSSHDAYTSLPESERGGRLTTGPLAGAKALGGFQRVFVNKATGETVSVIWFGGALAGWPGVVHGGLSATIMDESLGRCAIRLLDGNTGVTANLELNYLKPVLSNSFYVIRASPMTEEQHGEGFRGHSKKRWVAGRLETLKGAVCVEAKGLFVVPKSYQTKTLEGDF